DETLTAEAHDVEKRITGLQNPTFKVPDDDPNDVGVDEASDLRFAFSDIAVQSRIFQRDRSLRGEQLQHRDSRRCKNMGRQCILKVEHANELGMVDQGQAENGTSLALINIRVRGKRRLDRGIVENGALPGS